MSKTIMVVDDEKRLVSLVESYLAQEGYRVVTANDGKEALPIASREKPDLIILDLMMPEMDGFTVLDHLKNNPDTASIPVIVVTAKELTAQEKDRLSGQIELLMQKGSFMDNELLKEIRTLVK